ncbi:MAG: heme exporter protein CcmB [Ignavibacteriales bacterium]|nr:heme exporter protein CcmB [Ignavibacteriales bacterium]
MNSTIAIFLKDIRSELRTRYALNSLVMFVITTISIVIFAIQAESPGSLIYAGILWIIIFFASMSGLSRTFVSEEERGTTLLLQLSAKPSTVLYGKMAFNIVLLLGLNLFTTILFFLFVPEFTLRRPDIFFLVIIFGTLALAVTSTMLAAIVAKANTKGTLYPVLSFPVLLPMFITVIDATKLAVEGAPFSETLGNFQMLISYLIATFIASSLLFDVIWKD